MKSPTVSVLMSVYNGERYLTEAVDSILGQTFADFEFIIINDGSTDSTADILRSYKDSRIRIFEQSNIGLTPSLNRGIALAQGEYIARMDDDDISMPDRLAREADFLDAHPEVGVVGTGCLIRDEIKGAEREHSVPISDQELRCSLVKGNPFIHSSVMMRKSVLEAVGGYDESYLFAQDYALWVQLAVQTQMANLPEVLVIHREHRESVSVGRRADWHIVWRSVWVRMGFRYKAFQSLDCPFYHVLYVLQPILFTFIEMWPDFVAQLGKLVQPRKSS